MKKIRLIIVAVIIFAMCLFIAPSILNASPAYFDGNGHYYLMVKPGQPWLVAKDTAESMTYQPDVNGPTYYGHLATITSQAEQNFIYSIFQGSGSYSIGAYQLSDDYGWANDWHWVTGEEWNYTNWGGGEPNNSGNFENWAEFRAGDGTWNDVDLSQRDGFIVEFEIIQQTHHKGPAINEKPLSAYEETDSGFVALLYNRILARDPEAIGLANQTAALGAGLSRMGLVSNFIFSEECQNKISVYSNEEFIKFLYQALFNRVPESSGLDNWLAAMDAGMTKADVVNAFTHSEEFAYLYL